MGGFFMPRYSLSFPLGDNGLSLNYPCIFTVIPVYLLCLLNTQYTHNIHTIYTEDTHKIGRWYGFDPCLRRIKRRVAL